MDIGVLIIIAVEELVADFAERLRSQKMDM